MALYDNLPIIPIEQIHADFFIRLSLRNFMRKLNDRTIALPVVNTEQSQKGQRGAYIENLAGFLDKRREGAVKELPQFQK